MPETLLLLPGMMCDERLFTPQIEAFGNAYDVHVPQLSEPSIEAMARSVFDGAPAGALNIAGLSMGGIVAMAMAGIAPERISRLALLDTNHHADLTERHEIRNRQIEEVLAGKLRAIIIEEMKPVYLAERNRGNQTLLDLLVEMAMDVGADDFVAQSVALRDRPDQAAVLRNLQAPTLILCGEEDRLCPLERHQEMAGLMPNAELEIVSGAGHITTLENPDAVNAALRNWLSRRPADGTS
ncbi:MAG: alpha/beta fold hydrolase [Pseudomonadota bacterium]